jgi:prepilin-type processing-associated H-X9-DG protein
MVRDLLKYARGVGLLLLLLLVLGFAGLSACGVATEYGIYAYDDDLVAGGQLLSASKWGEARNRHWKVHSQLLNYQHTFSSISPPSDVEGRPYHGWMALALPYGWQGGVSQFIDYQKPWDDGANKGAFGRRIQAYESPFRSLPRHNKDGYALAHIAGNSHIFDPGGHKLKVPTLDGQSQTILAGDVAGNYQPWGKPRTERDPVLGINKSKDGFGGPWAGGGAMMVFADGSVRMMSKDTSPEVLRALANPADMQP